LKPGELPIYEAVIAKGELKMKLPEDQTPTPSSAPRPPLCAPPPKPPDTVAVLRGVAPGPNAQPRGSVRMGSSANVQTISGVALTITQLVTTLRGPAERPIINKTGLTGLFDLHLASLQV
jgi:uncharacterized protein (TIGR03435 family)